MHKVNSMLEYLPVWSYLLAALFGVIILWPLFRLLLWKFFSFDRRVQNILAQKKSAEVRLGKIAEILSPLLEDFPVDVRKPGSSTVFAGQPVDYIHFDPEEGITFIEVKSGDARLSASQKALKAHVEAGNVSWVSFRVKE